MNGYQPKMRCNDCTKQNDCKKYKDDKVACKKYKGIQPIPPKTLSNVPGSGKTRKFIPLDVSRETYESLKENKLLNPNVLYNIVESSTKQRTVLSIRDFAILYEIADRKLAEIEKNIIAFDMDREEALTNPYYQDLLRIREKLGELNVEVETPSVEVE